MDNMHFEEEIEDKEYFQLKIQNLQERVKFLEEITKEMAFNKRLAEKLRKENADGRL